MPASCRWEGTLSRKLSQEEDPAVRLGFQGPNSPPPGTSAPLGLAPGRHWHPLRLPLLEG